MEVLNLIVLGAFFIPLALAAAIFLIWIFIFALGWLFNQF